MVNQRVGNYRIVRLVARGGMGAVYEASHLHRRLRAAIKVLRQDLAQDPALVERLFDEARAVDAIRHPGIVRILDCGQLDPDGSPYLVMEYLEGRTLLGYLSAHPAGLPPSDWPLLGEIAATMAAAHAAGIVHRDLKPANVMLLDRPAADAPPADAPPPDAPTAPDFAGRVKILDFGIAKLAEEHRHTSARPARLPTEAGSILGTPAYMAPEQWHDGSTVGAAADVYALGVMLVQCISGQLPFSGTPPQLMYQHLQQPAPDLRVLCPSVPPELAGLAARLLAKDPAARPTMKDVAAALRPPPPSSRSPPAPQRSIELRPGMQLGAYVLRRVLGRGGYGQVFLAEHSGVPGVRVAIKVLNPELLSRPDLAARFRIEATAIGRLEHPGIVRLREFTETDGQSYLVMDYLDGHSLRAWLDASSVTGAAPRVALGLLRQVASALVAAHRAGIIHRDLKPDNVMVLLDAARPGELSARVVDFGVAKLAAEHFGSLAEKAQTGSPIGTAAYMAPELWRVDAVTDRADVYALGVMAYEVLAGQRPFTGNQMGLMHQHLNREPRGLAELSASLPAELCALVGQMLSKEAARRPAMTEVEAALQRWERQLGAGAPELGVRAAGSEEAAPRGPGPLPAGDESPGSKAIPRTVIVDLDPRAPVEPRPVEPRPVEPASAPPPGHETLALPPAKSSGWLRGALAAAGLAAVLVPVAYLGLRPTQDVGRGPDLGRSLSVDLARPADLASRPAVVRWRIDSEPEQGAKVRRKADGKVMGRTPLVYLELPQGTGEVEFQLELSTYRTETIRLSRERGGTLKQHLVEEIN